MKWMAYILEYENIIFEKNMRDPNQGCMWDLNACHNRNVNAETQIGKPTKNLQ